MRLATTACAAILALSTAALAQVADPSATPMNNMEDTDHNALMHHSPKDMVPMNQVDHSGHNMLDNSTTPPPSEPK